jgi:hypothetical protein
MLRFLLSLLAGSSCCSALSLNNKAPPPQVSAPAGFTTTNEPKLFAVGKGDYSTMLSASVALGLRLGAGIFVHGWSPRFSLDPPKQGEYGLRIGPVTISDTSAAIRGELARPAGKLTLYEFDSSP